MYSVSEDSLPACYEQPTTLNLVLGITLTIGSLVSYLPQVRSIVVLRTSEGVSATALGLGLFCTSLTLLNHIILKYKYLECCQILPIGKCLENNLAFFQLVSPPLGSALVFIFLLIFFPTTPTRTQTYEQRLTKKLIAFLIFIGILLLLTVMGLVTSIMAFVYHARSDIISNLARAFGIASAIGVILHWAPQIYKTWSLRSPRALSVVTLIVQAPGSILIIIFQAFLNHADWTTWVPYVASSTQQTILIILCLVFMWQERKRKNAGGAVERLPLTSESSINVTT